MVKSAGRKPIVKMYVFEGNHERHRLKNEYEEIRKIRFQGTYSSGEASFNEKNSRKKN